MDWNDVQLLLEVMRTGSFTGAADALGISKPTVSRRIEYLEQSVGVRLFNRGPHGTRITRDAEQLLRKVEPIQAVMADFEHRLKDLGARGEHKITARMTEGVQSYLMTPVMARRRLGPLGIAADALRVKLPAMRFLRMDAGEPSDLAFLWSPVGELPVAAPSDRVTRLVDVSFVPFVSRKYGGARTAPRSFRELAQHKLISMRSYEWFSAEGWREWHDVLGRAGKDPGNEPVVVDLTHSVGDLLSDGAGIGVLPTYAPMYDETLSRVEVSSPPMGATLWLACSEQGHADKRTRACAATIRTLFQNAEWMTVGH